MAVIYDLYRTPMPEEKKNKVRYHARPVTHGTVDTEEIASQISERCSLNPVDVIATLSALKDLLGRHLRNGERVHLDGIGYFHISLSCEELRGLKESTAYRHIKRLVAEKKLQNIGHERHPIYVPVPGNYRVSVDRAK